MVFLSLPRLRTEGESEVLVSELRRFAPMDCPILAMVVRHVPPICGSVSPEARTRRGGGEPRRCRLSCDLRNYCDHDDGRPEAPKSGKWNRTSGFRYGPLRHL